MNIITLDENVIQALHFFSKTPPPKIHIDSFTLPFVVGSGNAYNTGLIIFSNKNAIFADESNFKSIIEYSDKTTKDGVLKDVVVISASGGKDSVWEIELAKKYGLKTTLLTTKENSDAAKITDKILVFKSIAEPYTYNTSTYMGMILGATGENTSQILQFIERLSFPSNFNQYNHYSFVVPDAFMHICPMLDIKKSELFGPNLSLRAFSQGHARHAKFVIRSSQELVISLGQQNKYFGEPEHRWDIQLPTNTNYALIMAITYFIVGKIQRSKPAYYINNIKRYVNEDGPLAYGLHTKKFEVIVPGSK